MSVETFDMSRALSDTESVLSDFDKKLYDLIEKEQFLNDLLIKSSGSDLKDVRIPPIKNVVNALELHFGQAMNLTLVRGDGVRLPIVIPINARVIELQWTVQESLTSYLTSLRSSSNPGIATNAVEAGNHANRSKFNYPSISPTFISWRNLWKTKCLAIINPHAGLPPLSSPSIVARLDVPENRLQESYNLRNGSLITFVRRLKRK